MIKIDLSIYLKSSQYFKLFDCLLKEEPITKEAFLIEHNITPSSYRRTRLQEVNIGTKIIKKLSDILGYQYLSNNEIKDIEIRLNDIHSKVYFKIYDTFEEDLEYVENYINKKTLLFPVFVLFKVFMLFNKHVSCIKVIEDEEGTFKLLKKYVSFYSESLLEIYDFIECAFTKQIPSRILKTNNAYPMVYQVLASKYSNEYKYIESNYFVEKAIDIYMKDHNYKRALYATLPMLFNMNQMGNYEEVFKIANNYILMLKSFNCDEYEYDAMLKHLVVASFALHKYEYVISLLEKRSRLNLTQLVALSASIYLTDINKYDEWMKEVNYEAMNDDNINKFYYKNLDLYLRYQDKTAFKNLSECPIYETLIILLKRANH